jgi:long-subunit acyl-CoA synthetase (AMP-forming)
MERVARALVLAGGLAGSCACVGIVASNSPEWVIVDFASSLAGFTSVPYYPTAPLDLICQVLRKTKCWIVFTDTVVAERLDMKQLPDVQIRQHGMTS